MSLWTRDWIEAGVVGWCAEKGAAFVLYAPLGRGYLTGALSSREGFDEDDFRARNPRLSGEAIEGNRAIVETVKAVAGRLGATPAQVAIAWTLAQGEHVIPIPGTKKMRRLEENVAAAVLAAASAAVLAAAIRKRGHSSGFGATANAGKSRAKYAEWQVRWRVLFITLSFTLR
jgi:aryl-alcohol dehydrogenase-like predicted oxidoreductase